MAHGRDYINKLGQALFACSRLVEAAAHHMPVVRLWVRVRVRVSIGFEREHITFRPPPKQVTERLLQLWWSSKGHLPVAPSLADEPVQNLGRVLPLVEAPGHPPLTARRPRSAHLRIC